MQNVTSRVSGAAAQIGAWSGHIDLLVAPLDDFELILGIDFLVLAKAAVIPRLGGVMIMGEAQPCFVTGMQKETKGKEPLLSTIQVENGLKRRKATFLATF
ncbi:hypothetical protein IHE45_11G041900 [Dioscorea alata]|uniref:Uncharacterized protein n=1 Tax=Dioscorea alata TaxID=55571 RepID=A0ACB7V692_DIOAL|nr:hypothetical protein IHE45_11G041900 [Dioscorea alata]